jgi:5'(3')-deoxyribonucleotidase
MIKRIYLDLDDVLNTLVPSVFRALSYELDCRYEAYPREYGWDIVGAANHVIKDTTAHRLHGVQYQKEAFWGMFNREFWASIIPTFECHQLVQIAESMVGRDSVWILTKAVGAESLAGKQDWVDSNMPWMRERMITCSDKDCCAAPDSLLIDDNQDNVQAFVTRGGHAIMRPRPWNDLWEFGDLGGWRYVRTMLGMYDSQRDAA